MTESNRTGDLLALWGQGDSQAESELIERLYPHLRVLVRSRIPRGERAPSLETTDLLHDAYLRLRKQDRSVWKSRAHFFAIAARVVRRVVVEELRHRRRQKRGGGQVHLPIERAEQLGTPPSLDWLWLDQALERLERIDPRAARIVEMRFFASLTVDEIGDILEVSPATVARGWRFARAWLEKALKDTE